MTTLLQQLGGLVLGSVPTMILFLITVAAYRLLVHAPLKKVLGERYARTEGAIENATKAIAAAETKTAEYEERVRAARAAVFHERHGRLSAVHKESELALTEARAAAQEKVANAVIAIEESAQAARLQLEASIGELTSEVLRVILPGNASQQEQAG